MISPAELTKLWRKHARGLGLFARVRCSASADDLVQEAFLRLAGQSQIPQDPLAWLARTVRNLAIDTARSETRRRRREQLFCEQKNLTATDELKSARWTSDDVADVLLKLDLTDRDIVVAHLWNGMNFRQIAEAFSLSSSTANRRYLAALKQLKLELDNCPDVRNGLASSGTNSVGIEVDMSKVGDLQNE